MTRQGSRAGALQPRLDALFEPRAVAVVGASSDPAKWGHILAIRALESGASRPVALVNRRGGQVLGRATHATLADARRALGMPLDLVVVCVPAPALVRTVSEAVESGARAIVAITAGLAELGGDGARLEAEAVAIARAGGAVLVGPNCLGIADTGVGLQLSHAVLPAGVVSVLSQSGNMVLDLAALLVERGLGVARFVSVGNQADVTVVELMQHSVEHAGTQAVAIYAEDVVDGRGFVEAARALADAGKPVVLLSPGRSAAAARSAVSHTGSMTSPAQVVDAACDAGGVRRVENPTQMADLLEGLVGARRMPGRRVVVLTDGGGHGAMAADALVAADLETPVLGPATGHQLRSVLWAGSSVTNPVDLAGAGDRDPMNYAHAVQVLLSSDEVDGVLLTGYFGGYSAQPEAARPGGVQEIELAAAEAMATAVQRTGQASRRAHDLSHQPERGVAPRGRNPRAPRRRPGLCRARGPGGAARPVDGRAPGRAQPSDRLVVRDGACAVRRRGCAFPVVANGDLPRGAARRVRAHWLPDRAQGARTRAQVRRRRSRPRPP